MKFMGLFSLLFGAGVLLFADKAEAKGAKASGFHYRRSLWLLLFGLLHGYLLWSGDILFAYAVCALLVFPFRRISPVKLLIIGLLIVSISSGLYLLSGLSMPKWGPEAVESMSLELWAPDDAGKRLADIGHTWTALGWELIFAEQLDQPTAIVFKTLKRPDYHALDDSFAKHESTRNVNQLGIRFSR